VLILKPDADVEGGLTVVDDFFASPLAADLGATPEGPAATIGSNLAWRHRSCCVWLSTEMVFSRTARF
jgi:hypothetical protein